MVHSLFTIAGILSAIHLYSYGQWLKTQGNRSACILAFLTAATAIGLPIFKFFKKIALL
jgi:hypothetical protein